MIEEYHLVKKLKDRLKLNSGIVSLELPYPVKRIKKFSKYAPWFVSHEPNH
jgi:hypothetical protein